MIKIEMQYKQDHIRREAKAILERNMKNCDEYDQLLVGKKENDVENDFGTFKHMVLTGQISNLLLPIRADHNDSNLDKDRAEALVRFKQFARI